MSPRAVRSDTGGESAKSLGRMYLFAVMGLLVLSKTGKKAFIQGFISTEAIKYSTEHSKISTQSA